jgi:D-glycero-alpha-D-manno-heptose-7-phosphate kinase
MSETLFRAKAPLRIGLGGGGTDIAAYSDKFGGAILNATISMYAYATIKPLDEKKIVLNAIDQGINLEFPMEDHLQINGELDLLKGVYNRVVRDFTKEPLAFELSTYVDAPPGSGLGSSSTLVVAIIGAFAEWLRLPFGEYDIASLAYDIERIDLGYSGGKQDQYAATFGGFNFMEFYKGSKVIVNPLRIKHDHIIELEFNLVLFYTAASRLSSEIIDQQTQNISGKETERLEAMHNLKELAFNLKEALLTGRLDSIGENLHNGWIQKKKTASCISNPKIDEIYETALRAGATGGKISGAGGGGFTFFYCLGNTRYDVIEALKKFGGEFRRFDFTKYGLTTWRSKGNICK